MKIGIGKVVYLPKFTLAQFDTISALMEIEGWAIWKAIEMHGGHAASLGCLVEKGVAEYRELEGEGAFPIREWRISADYLKAKP